MSTVIFFTVARDTHVHVQLTRICAVHTVLGLSLADRASFAPRATKRIEIWPIFDPRPGRSSALTLGSSTAFGKAFENINHCHWRQRNRAMSVWETRSWGPGTSLHAPIYRNFYRSVHWKIKLIQTFRCRATRESLCANGSSRAPPPKLSGELSSQAPYEKKTNSGAFPMKHQPCPSCTDVQVDVSMEKKLSKKHTNIPWYYVIFQNRYIHFSEEI